MFYAKFMDTFGVIAYVGSRNQAVYDIKEAQMFHEKDHAKAWLKNVPAHKRRSKFQKIGFQKEEINETTKAKELAFY